MAETRTRRTRPKSSSPMIRETQALAKVFAGIEDLSPEGRAKVRTALDELDGTMPADKAGNGVGDPSALVG